MNSISNIVFCSLLVLVESLQALVVLILIYSFFPIPPSPFLSHLFSRQLAEVFPKRDMFFYHAFVAMVILGQIGLLSFCRKQLNTQNLFKEWRNFFFVELGWLFLMLFAVFKIFVYGYAPWAKYLLYGTIAGAVLSKVFFKELEQTVILLYENLQRTPAATISKVLTFIFPLIIAAIIFVPDLEAAVARMWIGDCLTHTDSSLMGQAWAYTKGIKLNVDIYAPYGVGMTAFVSLMAKALGGLSYEKSLGILVGGGIIYFILCFVFLRLWLANDLLAMAGTLLAIKWQMFHQGVYPFVFNYPYSTVMRYWFDIIFFLVLLAYIRQGRFYLLAAAGAVAGLGLLYATDTGVYLLTAYLFYLVWWTFEGIVEKRESLINIIRAALFCLAAVFVSAFIWFYLFVGDSVFSGIFWKHMLERADYMVIGHGNLPMYKSLLEGDYSSCLMGFVVPLVYCGTLMAVVSLCFFKKIERGQILTAVLCVYGLSLYHYYVLRSANTSYYVVCVPFVFVLCWLCSCAFSKLKPRVRSLACLGLLSFVAFALLTTHAFLSYPNIFNMSPNPIISPTVSWPNKSLPFYFNNTPKRYPESFKLSVNSLGNQDEDLRTEDDFKTDMEFKEYFRRKFDFSEDARLIDRLTSPDDPVVLMSSFETRILMQADRKPFFYYFPFILSRPLDMRMFGFSILWTTDQLNTIMAQLDSAKPEYVFMEKIFLAKQVPRIYLYLFPEELYILNYLDKYYTPYQSGKYLVALKRI